MVKYYKHNRTIKLLTIFGGLSGLLYCLSQIANTTESITWYLIFGFDRFVSNLIGMILTALTLITAFKPYDPLPRHWLLLLAFGILITIYSWLMAGIFVIGGAIVCVYDDIFRKKANVS